MSRNILASTTLGVEGDTDSIASIVHDIEVEETFEAEVHVDGETNPLTLGSITKPKYIIVIADDPGVTWMVSSTLGASSGGNDTLGAYPFGAHCMDGAPESYDQVLITGSGNAKVYAGGDE